MEALPLIRSILSGDTGVTALRVGGVNLNAAPDGDGLPNVVLMAAGGGEGMEQTGPDGLLHERVRIWCRGSTAKQAGELAIAVDLALNGYAGDVDGASVQLVEKIMTTSDFDDKASVQRAILDFRIWWSRAA